MQDGKLKAIESMTSDISAVTLDGGKTPQQLCADRSERLLGALQLKQPDRIPIHLSLGYMVAELEGATRQELFENPDRAQAAMVKAALQFQPDALSGPWGGPELSRTLGDQSTKWPGYGLGPNGSFQFVESEYMKVEDYDDFLEDPADWGIRVFLPRVFSELNGLSLLPPLGLSTFGYYGMLNVGIFNHPEVEKALRALAKASQLQAESILRQRATMERLVALGFPPMPFFGTLLEAPFDFMSDTLRGMKGIFLDMRRCPDKLLAAQEKVARFQLQHAIVSSRPLVFAGNIACATFPLHRGSDGFMSLQQFERFYWPQLKSLFLKLIDHGITIFVFYEGIWDKRLKYLAELPKGKTVGWFQSSDIFKVKEVLGDTMCILGGMPVSMLSGGTVEQVRERTKKVCQIVGKGGGFIMTTGTGEMEGCKPELVKAWVDATKEFGMY